MDERLNSNKIKTLIACFLIISIFSIDSKWTVVNHVEAQEYVFNSKASIEDYIWSRAMAYNLNPKLPLEIARAESGLVINARNASSTASGLFQFINGTFVSFCVKGFNLADSIASKNDPSIQIECAVKMLAQGGQHHWSESKSIWDKRLVLD